MLVTIVATFRCPQSQKLRERNCTSLEAFKFNTQHELVILHSGSIREFTENSHSANGIMGVSFGYGTNPIC